MLTLKVVYGSGFGEKLYAADTIAWDKEKKKITLDKNHVENTLILAPGDACFVMNDKGSTISIYPTPKSGWKSPDGSRTYQ